MPDDVEDALRRGYYTVAGRQAEQITAPHEQDELHVCSYEASSLEGEFYDPKDPEAPREDRLQFFDALLRHPKSEELHPDSPEAVVAWIRQCNVVADGIDWIPSLVRQLVIDARIAEQEDSEGDGDSGNPVEHSRMWFRLFGKRGEKVPAIGLWWDPRRESAADFKAKARTAFAEVVDRFVSDVEKRCFDRGWLRIFRPRSRGGVTPEDRYDWLVWRIVDGLTFEQILDRHPHAAGLNVQAVNAKCHDLARQLGLRIPPSSGLKKGTT